MRTLRFFCIVGLAAALGWSSGAEAQSVVLDIPSQQPNASGSIVGTNTFQQVWPANRGRMSCTIQNNGTHTMFLYLGLLANATLTNSAQIPPGGSANCNTGPIVAPDQISIAGTANDAFYANQQ